MLSFMETCEQFLRYSKNLWLSFFVDTVYSPGNLVHVCNVHPFLRPAVLGGVL